MTTARDEAVDAGKKQLADCRASADALRAVLETELKASKVAIILLGALVLLFFCMPQSLYLTSSHAVSLSHYVPHTLSLSHTFFDTFLDSFVPLILLCSAASLQDREEKLAEAKVREVKEARDRIYEKAKAQFDAGNKVRCRCCTVLHIESLRC